MVDIRQPLINLDCANSGQAPVVPEAPDELFLEIVEAAKIANKLVANGYTEEFKKPLTSFKDLQFELFGLCTGIHTQNNDFNYETLSNLILSLFARTL